MTPLHPPKKHLTTKPHHTTTHHTRQYELAARCYARLLVQPPSPLLSASNSFEEVALKFVETGTAEGEAGLRVFLLERLALLGGGGGGGGGAEDGGVVRARFKTQRVMLCTWLMELYLKRLAALGRWMPVLPSPNRVFE